MVKKLAVLLLSGCILVNKYIFSVASPLVIDESIQNPRCSKSFSAGEILHNKESSTHVALKSDCPDPQTGEANGSQMQMMRIPELAGTNEASSSVS